PLEQPFVRIRALVQSVYCHQVLLIQINSDTSKDFGPLGELNRSTNGQELLYLYYRAERQFAASEAEAADSGVACAGRRWRPGFLRPRWLGFQLCENGLQGRRLRQTSGRKYQP